MVSKHTKENVIWLRFSSVLTLWFFVVVKSDKNQWIFFLKETQLSRLQRIGKTKGKLIEVCKQGKLVINENYFNANFNLLFDMA